MKYLRRIQIWSKKKFLNIWKLVRRLLQKWLIHWTTSRFMRIAMKLFNMKMTHKEITAHIRKRLKAAGINAKCKMQDLCGHKMIAIDAPKYGVEFTKEEQSDIVNIVLANKLTYIRGLEVFNNGTLSNGGKFEYHM